MQKEGQLNPQEQTFPISYKFRAYARFIRIIWRYNPALVVFRFALLILGAGMDPIGIYAFSIFIAAIASGQTDRVSFLLIIVIITYGLKHLIGELTYSQIDNWFSKSASLAATDYIWKHIAKLEPEALTKLEYRRSLDFVREDIWRLNRLTDQTEWFLRSALKFTATLGLAFATPWWVPVLVIIDSVLQAVNFWYESHKDIWVATWNSLDGRRLEYTRYTFLNAEHFRELRLLGAESLFLKKFTRAMTRILARFREVAFKSARNRTLLSIFHITAYGLMIVTLGNQALKSPELLSTLYISLNLFSLLGDAINGLAGSSSRIWSDMHILSFINRLLDMKPEPTTGLALPKEQLEIKFINVSYHYPGAKKEALSNINLTLREGEHIAIVGENGAGKSTFLRLLSQLDKPTKGKILLNNVPLEKYAPAVWRRAFHLMTQDAKLYEDFVRDNLLYGSHGKQQKPFSLNQSLEISGAVSVIDALPEKFHTFIGSWAAPPNITPHQVSGGQAQRLVISRSLVHGGRIIGFDEPTSAMDANAEMHFFENMLNTAGNRGLIFISHRFSTVRRAEHILVFDEGKLKEHGTHKELMQLNGKYAELYRQQAQWYT